MDTHADLGNAGERLLSVATAIDDSQFGAPTPCEGRTVGELLNHVVGLTGAFRAAAAKDLGEWTDADPSANGWGEVEPGWREALAERVPTLVEAWRSADAWEGMTRAGGVDLPGEVCGLVALNEVVLHGWDLARAAGQPYELDDATAEACMAFVASFDEGGTPGLFGPSVSVGADASTFDRLLARSGRDPHWTP